MQEERPYWKDIARLFGTIFFGILSVITTFIVIGIISSLLVAPFSKVDPDKLREYSFLTGDISSKNKILSIPVQGIILGQETEGGSLSFLEGGGVTYGYTIKEALYAAAKQDNIDGVVLEINSPGGTIYGSEAISDGITHYRETAKKPIIVYVSGLAASGGYWAAVAGDAVYADYGSTLGSIGVIMGPFTYYDTPVAETGGLLSGGIVTQNGIENVYVTAGKSKDVGNPYRRLTTEELDVLQEGVNNEYTRFVAYVANRRGISTDTIRNQIGALIYDVDKATSLKLIDGGKNREEAYAEAASRAKLDGNYQVVREQQPVNALGALLQTRLPWQATPPSSEPVSSSCLLSTRYLAYHGDINLLCRP